MPSLHDVLLAAAAQGLLLSVVILSLPSANRVANRLLAFFVAVESVHLLCHMLVYAHPGQAPPLPLRMLFCLRLVNGPVLYLYVRALTDPAFRIEPGLARYLLVLAPALAWFLHMASDPASAATSMLELQKLPATVAMSAYYSVLMAAFALLARQRLSVHQHRLQQALSAVESLSLHWLMRLLTAIIAMNLLHLSLDLLRLPGLVDAQSKVAVNLAMTMLLIYFISIGGLRQPRVFTEPVRAALAAIDEHEERPPAMAGPERSKYLKSGLDDERKSEIWARLKGLLERERPYLNATLDLPKLARCLSVRPQELSEVINTQHGGTFYDLINRSRVDAAKALLADSGAPKRKMLDIALSVGFCSQSTFYSQFKKLTGMTPTAYRDAQGAGTADTGPISPAHPS
jgi:AraC-like DNA-binding protein